MGSLPRHFDPSDARRRRRNGAAFAMACGALVWATALFYLFSTGTDGSEADGQDRDKPPPTIEILYNYDATDPEQLVSNADAVFVGRVDRESGHQPLTSTIPGDSQPQTQYQVTVLDAVSATGEAGQSLVVNQIGGRSSEDGREYVVAGVVGQRSYIDSMLEPGDEYLFVATRNPRTDFWDLTAQPQGKVPLSGASPAERRKVVSAFESAARGDGSQPAADSSERR